MDKNLILGLLIITGVVAGVLLLVVPFVVGAWIAIKASALIGFIALLLEPAPWAIGAIYLVSHQNVVQLLVDHLSR